MELCIDRNDETINRKNYGESQQKQTELEYIYQSRITTENFCRNPGQPEFLVTSASALLP